MSPVDGFIVTAGDDVNGFVADHGLEYVIGLPGLSNGVINEYPSESPSASYAP